MQVCDRLPARPGLAGVASAAEEEERRQTWAALGDMLAELADYLGQPVAQVEARCRGATAELAQAWQTAAPTTAAEIAAFYRETDLYLYDLTWWHMLGTDESALVQVQALEVARARQAEHVLEFGSGIGSLGLVFATHGYAVTLAEINPTLQDYARWRFARRGLDGQFIDPEAAELPAATFDFISVIDVFEHLPDPQPILARLAAALRPGGTLLIRVGPWMPDTHPMHLWDNPALLLKHVQACGLWLEQSIDETLILRRGEGARYALKPALQLVPDQQGERGLLLALRPLLAMRLNPQAFAVLSHLQQQAGATAAEVADAIPSLPLHEASTFLEHMAHRRILERTPPDPGIWPTVSIIIPAYGRAAATRACVESLLALDYPDGRVEIIVVDDASDPPLAAALADLPVRLLRQEQNIGQSAARNLAAAEANGELLAFIDNDCVAAPDWLRVLVPHLTDPTVGIVGGRVVAPPPVGPVAAFEAVRSPLDMGPVAGEVGPDEVVAYLPTCNLIVRRDLLLQQAGFDAAMLLGEDVDFIWRALRSGTRACYVTGGQVVHHHRVELRALLQRRADYGSSEADLQQRHPAARRTMLLPVASLALLAALALRRSWWPVPAILGAIGLGRIGSEMVAKVRRLQRLGAPIAAPQVAAAVLREHGAALYHLGANVTRYYSLPLLVVAVFWRGLRPALALLLLVPAISDYYRLKPRLAPAVFVALAWLELAAYQLGVWGGCIKRRTLQPLRARLRWGR